MFGGVNPKQLQGMMKKMGISQEQIEASRVIIETEEKNIIIENPSITKIKMQGQESLQITGDFSEEESSSLNEGDIKMVMEKTGKSEKEVSEVLQKNDGDIAEAILQLS
jgi:nascent polypeptide-associated complex subunit alpha